MQILIFKFTFIIYQAITGAQDLYEAMYLYGMWVNYSSTNNVDVKDGRSWQEFSKNKTFKSKLLLIMK